MYSSSFYPRQGRVYPIPNDPRYQRFDRSFPNMNPPFNPMPMRSEPFVNGGMSRAGLPLSIPKGGLLKSLIPSSTMTTATTRSTISKVLSSTENVIATVNQVIPIYQQVKPLWDNSKGLRTAIMKFFPFNNRSKSASQSVNEVIEDPEIISPKAPRKDEPKKEEYSEENEPGKPFF